MPSARTENYVNLLWSFWSEVVLFHDLVGRKLGLHPSDSKIMRLLAFNDRTPSQLAERVGLTGAAITALLDRLADGGWVRRKRDAEDRRRITVTGNPAKMRQLFRTYDAQYRVLADVMSRYTTAEVAAIMDFLERTRDALTAQNAKLREDVR
jgi:DNA-binding MarR family transcriptional regulator